MIDPNQIPIKVGVRDGGVPEDPDYELHLECRFPDGRKGAMVRVDPAYPQLATLLCAFLNSQEAIGYAIDQADL